MGRVRPSRVRRTSSSVLSFRLDEKSVRCEGDREAGDGVFRPVGDAVGKKASLGWRKGKRLEPSGAEFFLACKRRDIVGAGEKSVNQSNEGGFSEAVRTDNERQAGMEIDAWSGRMLIRAGEKAEIVDL